MRWEELEYFFSLFSWRETFADIWCGSGRFLEQYREYFWKLPEHYLGVDLSLELIKEAKKSFPENDFIHGNMLDIADKFAHNLPSALIMIASFHHVKKISERKYFLESVYWALPKWGKIYMTNWNLLGEKNFKKYKMGLILESQNDFGSLDFLIKFWDNERYYHGFHLSELECLAKSAGFRILENRSFSGEKNIVTILQK